MATFVVLGSWTAEGARAAKDTVARAEQVRDLVHGLGGNVIHVFWLMGRYDAMAIWEAPDEETATAISVAIASAGMVRTETLRAFDATEMAQILSKLA